MNKLPNFSWRTSSFDTVIPSRFPLVSQCAKAEILGVSKTILNVPFLKSNLKKVYGLLFVYMLCKTFDNDI